VRDQRPPSAARFYLALVHYPVYNREGDIVATSITPLDIHDLGRLALTFGVKGYFLTNPYEAQRRLVAEVIYHWQAGFGGEHNPHRKRALGGANVVASVEAAFDDVSRGEGEEPLVVATSARPVAGAVAAEDLLLRAAGKPVLVLFGTGHGLTDDLLSAADFALDPIGGAGDFNHLPVRSAVSIYLDRIFNPRRF